MNGLMHLALTEIIQWYLLREWLCKEASLTCLALWQGWLSPLHTWVPLYVLLGAFPWILHQITQTSNAIARERKEPDSADRATSTSVYWSKQTESLPNFQDRGPAPPFLLEGVSKHLCPAFIFAIVLIIL